MIQEFYKKLPHISFVIILSFCAIILQLFLLNILHNIYFVPYIELVLVYYLTSRKMVNYSYLFIIGLLIDQLYGFHVGFNSIVLILMNLVIKFLKSLFPAKSCLNDFLLFAIYIIFVISIRYITKFLFFDHLLFNYKIFYNYLITIFVYPVFHYLVSALQQIVVPNCVK